MALDSGLSHCESPGCSDLSNNGFTGPIPTEIGDMANLQFL